MLCVHRIRDPNLMEETLSFILNHARANVGIYPISFRFNMLRFPIYSSANGTRSDFRIVEEDININIVVRTGYQSILL